MFDTPPKLQISLDHTIRPFEMREVPDAGEHDDVGLTGDELAEPAHEVLAGDRFGDTVDEPGRLLQAPQRAEPAFAVFLSSPSRW